MARKAGLVWGAAERPDTEGIEAYADASLLLRALGWPFSFGLLVPLAAVGALAHRRDWRRLWLLPAMAASLAASVALFYVFARYRYAMVPVLVPLGAAGGVALWRAFAVDRRAGAWLAAAGLAVAVPVIGLAPRTNGLALTHYGIGSALLDDGRLAEAQAELERAAAADPGFAPARSRLGDVLRKRGDAKEALLAYNRALELDPSLADAHAGRGIALERLGRAAEADTEYARALELDPSHADANNNSANRLLQSGQPSEALARYERALASRPGDPDVASNYAAALVQTRDFERAIAVVSPVIASHPEYATARFGRAAALSALGRNEEARADLRAVLAIPGVAPEYAKAAQEALAALGGP